MDVSGLRPAKSHLTNVQGRARRAAFLFARCLVDADGDRTASRHKVGQAGIEPEVGVG